MFLSYEQKQTCLNVLEYCLCSSRISPKSNGQLIRAYHLTAPLMIVILFILAPRFICNLCFAIIVLIGIAYVLFDGCILSRLENRLCQDNFNMFDPFLEFLNMDTTNKNRFYISNRLWVVFLEIVGIIYYYRFIV